MSRKQLPAVTLALTALAAAGCGSSKGGATTTASTAAATTPPVTTSTAPVAAGRPLSRARWIAAGDAVCHRVQNQLASVTSDTPAQFARALPQAAIFYATEAEDLGKLVPPRAMARDWAAYVNDVHLFGEYTTIADEELRKGQRLMSPSLRAKVAALQADMKLRATRDGFKWCAIGA